MVEVNFWYPFERRLSCRMFDGCKMSIVSK